jgi:PKD repeat protein
VVAFPSTAFSGDVMVKQSGTGNSTLSNAWPVDLVNGGGSGTDPDAKFTATPTSGGTPLVVAFSDESTGSNLSSWSWSFGDGNTSTQASPTHTYTTPGTFDVSLTVVGSNGSDTETKQDFVVVSSGAACVTRPGSGVNPVLYFCANDPKLGTTWIASVTGGPVGASGLSLLVGFGDFLPSPLGTVFGELLIDPSTGPYIQDSTTVVNGFAGHFIPIPNDNALSGLQVYTQVYLGGVGVLTNGLDLLLGS